MLLGQRPHGSELHKQEWPPVQSGSLLAEENGATHSRAYDESDYDYERARQDESRRCAEDVERSFCQRRRRDQSYPNASSEWSLLGDPDVPQVQDVESAR